MINDYLFREKGFGVPQYGRSNAPTESILDHPGVWEKPEAAYLNEVLIRKTGIAATLAILFAQARISFAFLSGRKRFGFCKCPPHPARHLCR